MIEYLSYLNHITNLAYYINHHSLEQPHYTATRKLFESLSCVTKLQRLCLYLDKGR